jgi:hypothetical protein
MLRPKLFQDGKFCVFTGIKPWAGGVGSAIFGTWVRVSERNSFNF